MGQTDSQTANTFEVAKAVPVAFNGKKCKKAYVSQRETYPERRARRAAALKKIREEDEATEPTVGFSDSFYMLDAPEDSIGTMAFADFCASNSAEIESNDSCSSCDGEVEVWI